MDDDLIRDLIAVGYLDTDLDATQEAIEWYFDVCDGRVDLADEQHPMFHYFRDLAGQGRLFGDPMAEYLFHYQRCYSKFLGWMDHLDAGL